MITQYSWKSSKICWFLTAHPLATLCALALFAFAVPLHCSITPSTVSTVRFRPKVPLICLTVSLRPLLSRAMIFGYALIPLLFVGCWSSIQWDPYIVFLSDAMITVFSLFFLKAQMNCLKFLLPATNTLPMFLGSLLQLMRFMWFLLVLILPIFGHFLQLGDSSFEILLLARHI
jgi:hypothetical protein